ncbi:MAG: hypothetical protein IBX64_12615 [Actinobacteria bacterium]|nr:hypothetical protein [Actinomycetota bacterium]
MAIQGEIPAEEPVQEVLRSLHTDPDKGLTSSDEAQGRLIQHGPTGSLSPGVLPLSVPSGKRCETAYSIAPGGGGSL